MGRAIGRSYLPHREAQPCPSVDYQVRAQDRGFQKLLSQGHHWTVHAPLACHPEKTPALLMAPIDAVFAPPNAAVNVMDKFTVRLFPDPATDDVARLSAHWLFDSVPAEPRVPPEPMY